MTEFGDPSFHSALGWRSACISHATKWFNDRTFGWDAWSTDALRVAKRESGLKTSLILPAREASPTVDATVREVMRLRECKDPLVDQVILVHAGTRSSRSDTDIALEVHQESSLQPNLGPALGKGDALWRALNECVGDIVLFADTDTVDFHPASICGLLIPFMSDSGIDFVKGAFRRPLVLGDDRADRGGGRVTELTAKPLLNLFFPELTGFVQPLAGEFAGRADLLRSIAFVTGYGVESGILIDVLATVGLERMAQIDLGIRQNSHQSLEALGRMSYVVARTILERALRYGRLDTLAGGPLLLGTSSVVDEFVQTDAVGSELSLRIHTERLLERHQTWNGSQMTHVPTTYGDVENGASDIGA